MKLPPRGVRVIAIKLNHLTVAGHGGDDVTLRAFKLFVHLASTVGILGVPSGERFDVAARVSILRGGGGGAGAGFA